MMFSWTLNAVGLFVTTTGALLIFMNLARTTSQLVMPKEVDRGDVLQRLRRLQFAVGLLSLWLVMEDAAFILS